MDFDKAVEIAKRTWYPEDHPLHMNPHHPLGKLLGEWGELLDDYMKSLYKPGYIFEPEDELGDIWYYIRILAYQSDYTIEHKPVIFWEGELIFPSEEKTEIIIAEAMKLCLTAFVREINGIKYHMPFVVDMSYFCLDAICTKNHLSLDDLTASNWQKLKPGSERGDQWMKARVNTNYVGGKVALD
jgi:hypothetical protein